MNMVTRDALRYVIIIALGVFCAEAFVMFVLSLIPPLGTTTEALVDSSMLTLLLTPLFYGALYRPFRRQLDERLAAEHRLHASLAEARQLYQTLTETQERLLASEKMVAMGHLAAGVAHEINNPVGFVGSNIASMQKYQQEMFRLLDAYETMHDLMQSDAERFSALCKLRGDIDIEFLKDDVNNLLRESLDGIARVRRIVKDLKDFSRADDGVWEAADLNAEMERTLNVVRNELKYHVTIVKEFGELPPVLCIAPQINQVFLNLLVNAGHAIEAKGTITIATAVDGDHVRVSIADTGSGMSEETLRRAFEPFYTTKPRGQGTGLGLSVSAGIVEKHGGRIAVKSAFGVGTTFDVLLPIRQAETGAAAA